MQGKIHKIKNGESEYIYPLTVADAVYINQTKTLAEKLSDIDNSVYTIELDRWGISNDGTNPIPTTTGINNALSWASNKNIPFVKLPAGLYTVAKGNVVADINDSACIKLQSNMTLDISGCVIQKETNGFAFYRCVVAIDKKNVTLIGGTIKGDRLTHDYTTDSDNIHEGCIGLHFEGSFNVCVEGTEIHEFPGYSVSLTNKYNQIANWNKTNFESGYINSKTGDLQENTNYMRLNKLLLLAPYLESESFKNVGHFIIAGNGYGAFGLDVKGYNINLSSTIFVLFFYDDSGTFKGTLTRRNYDSITLDAIPSGATKFRLAFKYDYANILDNEFYLELNAMKITQGVVLRSLNIHDSFSLAIAITGAAHVLIEQCEMYNIGFTSKYGVRKLYYFPMGIDIEDGYNANQHIIVRNNIFRDNESLNFNAIQAKNVYLQGNKFQGGGVAFWGTKSSNNISEGNEYNCSVGSGESASFMVFRNDHFCEATLNITDNTIYEGCTFDDVNMIFSAITEERWATAKKYAKGARVIPNSNTSNGFYYVCNVASDVVTTTEPTWSTALTAGATLVDNVGNTWIALVYDPEYRPLVFRECIINYNKPEETKAFLIRRCNVSFENCDINSNTLSGLFSDGSFSWDYASKNRMAFKNCRFQYGLGSGYGQLFDQGTGGFGSFKVNKLEIIRCEFYNPKEMDISSSTFFAKEAIIEENTFKNFSFKSIGVLNTTSPSSISFKNNKVSFNKKIRVFGDNLEGILIAKYNRTLIEENELYMENLTVLNRPLRICPEELFFFNGNTVISLASSPTNVVELRSAQRDGIDSGVAIPTTTLRMRDNYFKNTKLQPDAKYDNQIGFIEYCNNVINDALDPYEYTNDPLTLPSGKYFKGKIIQHVNPASGQTGNWICTLGGIACVSTWTANQQHLPYRRIVANGYVWESSGGNSGATSPSWSGSPIAGVTTVIDNTITWRAVGTLPVFKSLTTIG